MGSVLDHSRLLLYPAQARLDDAVAQAAGAKEFTDIWNKKAPGTMLVPELPSLFLAAKLAGKEKGVQGDLFPVNFFTPHCIITEAEQVS